MRTRGAFVPCEVVLPFGLVERSEAGRNPRLPSVSYSGVRKIDVGEDQSNEGIRKCRDLALDTATTRMRADPLSEQLVGAEKSRLKGTRAGGEKADPQIVHYFYRAKNSRTLPSEVTAAISAEVRKAFDYRKLQWVLEADVYRLGEQTICRGEVGVAARAPDDRSPRAPAAFWSTTWEMTQEESARGAEDTCRQVALKQAIENAVEEPWDKTGLPTWSGPRKPDSRS